MKKTMFIAGLKKSLTYLLSLLLVASICISCNEEEMVSKENLRLIGTYTLSDLMVVNYEDGIPQGAKNLAIPWNELSLNSDGTFLSFYDGNLRLQKGNWSSDGDRLTLRQKDGSISEFNFLESKDGSLELEQSFEGDGSLASGDIYYTFVKD